MGLNKYIASTAVQSGCIHEWVSGDKSNWQGGFSCCGG